MQLCMQKAGLSNKLENKLSVWKTNIKKFLFKFNFDCFLVDGSLMNNHSTSLTSYFFDRFVRNCHRTF